MKEVLKARSLEGNIEAYYDEDKKLFSPVPLYPFLSTEEVTEAVKKVINIEELSQEVKVLEAKAMISNAWVPETKYFISLVEWNEYPELMKLLSITREWAFRNDGGGVGEADYDHYDLMEGMQQLLIINPEYTDPVGAIIGGYRFWIHNADSYHKGPMGAHFEFSEQFKKEQWIELGRSFLNPFYKDNSASASIDYVVHGLGYIHGVYPESVGYFGKVTLYNIYEQLEADKFLLAVAKEYFDESEAAWVKPEERVEEGQLTQEQRDILDRGVFKGMFYILKTQYKINLVRIMAVYNRMTELKRMMYFGAFRHDEFGKTTEMGIGIRYEDVYDVIKEKYILPYHTK